MMIYSIRLDDFVHLGDYTEQTAAIEILLIAKKTFGKDKQGNERVSMVGVRKETEDSQEPVVALKYGT